MPLKVAQAWSGHKTLSVLLDAYYGVMQHDDTSRTNASKTPSRGQLAELRLTLIAPPDAAQSMTSPSSGRHLPKLP